MFDPYSAVAQQVYKALGLAILLAALVYGWQRINVLELERDAARGEAVQLAREIEIQLANAEFSASLARRAQERATALRKSVEAVKGGIVHVEVPEACRAAMAPLAAARTGLLQLQSAQIRVDTAPGDGVRR